jgi:hypothetical protein
MDKTKAELARERLDILNSDNIEDRDLDRVEELEQLMDEITEEVYEHEVVTTIRVTVRSLSPYLDKAAFLEDYAYITDMGDALIHNQGDDYPRVVEVSVIDDEVEFFDKQVEDA